MPSQVYVFLVFFFPNIKRFITIQNLSLKLPGTTPQSSSSSKPTTKQNHSVWVFSPFSEGKTKSSFGFSFSIQTKTVVSFLRVTLLQCRSFNSSFLEFKLKVKKNKRKDPIFFFSIYIQKKFCSFEILFFSAEENCSVHYQNYYFCIKQRLKQL